ncbi:MAG: DEAD/DEAH box helicase [Candidatus Aenigmatarchaeota archaeon]
MFKDFSPKMQALIKERGFVEPTLAQRLGIPEILKGSNVLIVAPTGIGKTEAACLPLFDKISSARSEPISLLYITPLRALNRDLLDRLMWWANKLDVEIAVRHGDTSQNERKSQADAPPHVLISTPETLQAMLVGKRMREHLKNVKHVVIDEIHELVSNKRGAQLSLALERLSELAPDFQRIGLSATVGSPELVARFLGPGTKVIHAEGEKKYDIRVEYPKPTSADESLSDDLVISPTTVARLRRLHELIKSHKSVLTFTNTRETAEVLSSRLRTLDKDLAQEVHHGSLSKERRIKSEQKFKAQELKSIIATSSLELGIDIGSCDLAVQYLSPRQVSRIIQRVGRSGHHIGATSKGVILSGDEDLFESAVIAKRASEKKLEPIKAHELALDVLASQIVGLSLEYKEIGVAKAFEVCRRAFPFRDISKKEFDQLIEFLDAVRLVWINQTPLGPSIRPRKRAFKYYFSNLSMIPDTVQYRVLSVIENEPIGSLDEEFVAEYGLPGQKFICSGRAWRVIGVDGLTVTVEPVEDIESAIPAWEGELIPVPFEVAQEVGRLRREVAQKALSQIREEFPIDSAAASELLRIIDKQASTHPVPDETMWLIESHDTFVVIHTCCGSLVNDTIGRYLAAILTAKTGVAVTVKCDPYRIILQTKATPEQVKFELENAKNIEEVLRLALCRSSLFKHRFVQVARRFGIIAKDARYDKLNLSKIIAQYAGTPVEEETLREIFFDKLDVINAESILDAIRKKKIKLTLKPGLSHLGELGLIHQFSELIKPAQPEEEIFKAFKRRLMATRVRLLCMNCADYSVVKQVKDVDDQPECQKCGSRLIAALHPTRHIVQKIAKARLKKKPLNSVDLHEFQTARRSADLVIVYGKKAVIALAGHGVGPESAARILAKLQPTQEAFYRDILEAERTFARTKPYWS